MSEISQDQKSPMLRTLNLAKRSSLILMVAGSLATADLSAQHPVVSADVSQIADQINFSLSNPTPMSGQNGTRRAFLACYFAMEGGGGGLTKLLKKSVGAVAPYSSTAPGMPSFVIPNADTTTANAIPTGEFTVPPAVIAHAIQDVNWAHSSEFMHTFSGPMSWEATGLGGSNLGTGLDWPAFATGLVMPQIQFDTKLLARALVARQIGYVENLPATDITVVTKAKALVDMCALDEQLISFNTILVEVQELPSNNQPVKIKLSRSHNITARLPGSGGSSRVTLDWDGIYPIVTGDPVTVAAYGVPLAGPCQMVVQTTSGLQAINADLSLIGSTYVYTAIMPLNALSGEAALINLTHMQPVAVDINSQPSGSFWTYLAPHSVNFVPFPMPNQGTF